MVKLKKKKIALYLVLLTLLIILAGYIIYTSPIRLIEKYKPLGSENTGYSEVDFRDNNLFVLLIPFSEDPEKLIIFDISDRSKPKKISETIFPGLLENVKGVTIVDDYMYIVSPKRGILIVDISDTQSPRIVTEYNGANNGFYASAVLIDNNIGFVREYIKDEDREQLHILSLEDPLAITELSIIRNGGEPLLVENNYLYTRVHSPEAQQLASNNYLSILDISDPSSPVVVKEFFDFIQLMAIEIQGDKMYISAHDNILVADISDPINPIILGELDGYVDEFVADNNYVYYLYTFGVGVIDVSDSRNPARIDQDGIHQGRDFILIDEFIYLVDGYDGLFVYKTNQKTPSPFLKLSSLWFQVGDLLDEILYKILVFLADIN